jgi:hypothetical protein
MTTKNADLVVLRTSVSILGLMLDIISEDLYETELDPQWCDRIHEIIEHTDALYEDLTDMCKTFIVEEMK